MQFNKLSLYWRLVAGFAAVIALVIVLGIAAINQVNAVAGLTEKLHRHPMAVSNAALDIKTLVISLHRDMRSLALNPVPGAAERVGAEMDVKDRRLEQLLVLVRERYLGDPRDIDGLDAAYSHWHVYRDESLHILQGGRADRFLDRTRGEGNDLAEKTERETDRIIEFARNKAAEFNAGAEAAREEAQRLVVLLIAATVVLALLVAAVVTRGISRQIERLGQTMSRLSDGELGVAVPYTDDAHEIGRMARAVRVFQTNAERLDARHWVKTHLAALSAEFQAANDPRAVGERAIGRLAELLGAGRAVFFLFDTRTARLERVAGYALGDERLEPRYFALGQGLIGQCAKERNRIVLAPVPAEFCHIGSALGAAAPASLYALPLIGNGRLVGAIELGFFGTPDARRLELLEEVAPLLALSIDILEHTQETRRLLEESQLKSEELATSQEELQSQQDELALRNVQLQERNMELQTSEEELRSQQEELRAVNEQVQEKSAQLEAAMAEVKQRAAMLDRASRYKSEFLANMSHELRTPLNSLLILARDLAENSEGNLSADQVESARVILDGGQNLLSLINDILDLSKVEAGKLDIHHAPLSVDSLVVYLDKTFRHMALEKGLGFSIDVAAAVPAQIVSDLSRIEQILTNLTGNAIKFTEHGAVSLHVAVAAAEALSVSCRGKPADTWLAFTVADSGIGIPADKLDAIFAAFEQLDGRPARKYGGSGLGLAISRKLADMLGGGIGVVSEPGQGSRFTLFLPALLAKTGSAPAAVIPGLRDDREQLLTGGGDAILLVEDDLAFAAIVGSLVRKKGYRLLHAADGADGLALAERFMPRGIILDELLPSLEGHEIVQRLRQSPGTRGIPVHFISALNVVEGMGEQGVLGCLTKPVSRVQIEQVLERLERAGLKQSCRLLVVAAAGEAEEIAELFRPRMQQVHLTHGVEDGLARLAAGGIDLLILDPVLPAEDGVSLLERAERLPPVVIYTPADLLPEQLLRLREYTDSIVIKSEHSLERLTDEVVAFLHAVGREVADLAAADAPLPAATSVPSFDGRTVLVVDDDMRNLFALSKILRGRGCRVLMAKNGVRALEQAAAAKDIDAILMDIMMPDMDGYETIRRLRQMPEYLATPIIAVTALAMESDRRKCLEAGASEYLPKPVEPGQLFALLDSLLKG